MLFTSDSKYAFIKSGGDLLKLELGGPDHVGERTAKLNEDYVVALAPDDRTLALARPDSTLDLVNLEFGSRKTLSGHERVVQAAAFSPDGRTLASGGSEGTVRLWRIDVGEHLGFWSAARTATFVKSPFHPMARVWPPPAAMEPATELRVFAGRRGFSMRAFARLRNFALRGRRWLPVKRFSMGELRVFGVSPSGAVVHRATSA